MTRVRDHNIERVDGEPRWLKTTWTFNNSDFRVTNRNFQVHAWDAATGVSERYYTVPRNDGCYTDDDDRQSDVGYVIEHDNADWFYPYTSKVLTRVEHHVQMVAHNGYDDGVTNTVTFEYKPPVPPEVSLSQNGRSLTWTITADPKSKMSDTSPYYRTDTIFMVQTNSETNSYGWLPPINRYPNESRGGVRIPFWTGTFTEDTYTYTRPDAVTTLNMEKGIKYRVVAFNRGPSGCSEPGYSPVYTYGSTKPPTVTKTEILGDNHVRFNVRTNHTDFHPIDALLLERGEGVSTRAVPTDISFNTQIGDEKRDNIGNTIVFHDTDAGQTPSEDKAIYYRVKAYHSSSTENVNYGYADNPVRGGKPKPPKDVSVSFGTTTTVTWTNQSSCNPVYVVSLSVVKNGRRMVFSSGELKSTVQSYTFTKVNTSEGFSEAYASVYAKKNWGGLAKVTKSAEVESEHAVIPSINEIRLLEDGLSLYVSETHPYDKWDITEYSWHTRADGWESTEKPQTFEVNDATGNSHLIITKLEDGVEYFVRCRRYHSGSKSYGLYSSIVSTITGSTPGTPVLTATPSVAAGRGIEYTWDFQGATQAEAHLSIKPSLSREASVFVPSQTRYTLEHILSETPIVTVGTTQTDNFVWSGSSVTLGYTPAVNTPVSIAYTYRGSSIVEDFTVANPANYKTISLVKAPIGSPVVTINGRKTTAFSVSGATITLTNVPQPGSLILVTYTTETGTIDIDIDNSDQGYVFETDSGWNGTLTATVKVTCGGKWSAASNSVTTTISQPPTCTLAAGGTLTPTNRYGGYSLTALPLSVNLGGTGNIWELTLKTANPTNDVSPAGDNIVGADNVVWTTRSTESGLFDVISEPGIIVTEGQYELTCISTESNTGSKSEPVTIGFTADWSVRATEPSISVEIKQNETTGRKEAHVTARRGSGDDTSKLTIWRYTADGAISCAENAGDSVEYIDPVPPYQWNRCSYIAQSTTVDGDIRWRRCEYSLPAFGATINFGNDEVILPFNIQFDDSYSNEFESRAHLDGHRSGHWTLGVDRTGKISGQLPLERYEDTVILLRRLGRYSGIAFVRDIRGVAFPCHVNVSLSNSFDELVYDVDLDITEISDDGTWRMTSGSVEKS